MSIKNKNYEYGRTSMETFLWCVNQLRKDDIKKEKARKKRLKKEYKAKYNK